jgi:GntR family transcriptional repressor for pyruvate dehydrogenase complex
MLPTLDRKKLRHRVADRIKHYITSENLIPGDRMPTENELAVMFGVSRLSLREATKALEFLGILVSKPGVGLTVGQIDLDRVTNHLGFHPALHRVDPIQLIDSRIIIETGVLPHVAQRMTEDESIHRALNDVVDQSRLARDLQAWIALDITFHRTLMEASGLTPLVAFGELLQIFFQRFRDSVKKAEWKSGIASHQRLIDLLRDQRVAEAVVELRSHIETHRGRLGAR